MKLKKESKTWFSLTCLLSVIVNGCAVLMTFFSAKILEGAELGKWDMIVSMVIVSIAVRLLYIMFVILHEAVRLRYLGTEEVILKRDLIRSTLFMPIRQFRKKDDAYFLNMITSDVENIRSSAWRCYPLIVSSVAALLLSLGMLLYIHRWLFFGALLLCGIPLVVNNIFTKPTERWIKKYSEASETFTKVLKETVEGNEEIRSNSAENTFLSRFLLNAKQHQRVRVRSALVNTAAQEFFYDVASFMQIAAMAIGGYAVVTGEMAVAMMLAAMNYYAMVSNHICNIAAYIIEIRSVRPLRKKIESEMVEETGDSLSGCIPPKADIVYDDVSFSFGERKLYDRFQYHFKKGGCYAISGESGSGKSTLMKLLLKYYDDYTGTIRIDHRDIRQMKEQELYQTIAVVNQSPYMFNASLYDNITMYGNAPQSDPDYFRQLINDLNLTALAARTGEQPLGDFGDNISGGERQRIAIARAICRKPGLIIFDEPVTGLDPDNTRQINDYIFSLKDITRIVISHDWSDEYRKRFDDVIVIS